MSCGLLIQPSGSELGIKWPEIRMKRKSSMLDSAGVEDEQFTERERELRRALRVLIDKSDNIISAIDLSTEKFAIETAQLSQATSAAEKVLLRKK